MSIIAKENAGVSIPLLDEGMYQAVCTRLIDLGVQHNDQFDKSQRKITLGWIMIGEEIEFNGEKNPRVMHKSYTTSLHEKSNLRKDLQAWRGRAFTASELAGFDLKNILHVPCQIQIIHEIGKKDGIKHANVSSIVAFPKGLPKPETDEIIYFDMEDKDTYPMWISVPKFLQEKIRKAENYETSGLKEYVDTLDRLQDSQPNGTEFTPIDDESEDELPF